MLEIERSPVVASRSVPQGKTETPSAPRAEKVPPSTSENVEKKQDSWQPQAKEAEKPPSLQEMLREAQGKAEERREAFRVKGNTRYGDAPIEAYARLARAQTQADVNAASGFAKRRIVQLKAALRTDEGSTNRIRAAMRQLQKVVDRSGRKKRELSQESIAQQRAKRRAEENRRQEELRLRAEQIRRKTMRILREGGYVSEAAISDRLATQADMSAASISGARPLGTTSNETGAAAAAAQYTAMANPAPAPEQPSFSAEG